MTVRLYIWRTPRKGINALWDRHCAYSDAWNKWGDRIHIGSDDADCFAIWLEFSSEEDAALFKLEYM